jgi:3-hydroxyacyl-CoA dehydrogenase
MGKILEQNKAGIKEKIGFFSELPAALTEADLVIEAVPEVLEFKRKVSAEMDRLAPLMPLWPPILSPSDFKNGRRHA